MILMMLKPISSGAQAYLGLNRLEEALADAEKAMAIAPDDVASRCIRGKALVRSGHNDAATEDFNFVIAESDPHGSEGEQLAEAYFLRGLILALREDLSAAIRDFTRSITKVPYRPEVYEARAAAYERQGKTKKAQFDREEAEYRRSKPPSYAPLLIGNDGLRPKRSPTPTDNYAGNLFYYFR